jgi:mitochondrial enoyl-[acyl-carrier protein] reductase / trans-2-enoyl-CoA reductase
LFSDLAARVARGELQARVHATYGVDQIREAVAAAATSARDGKIVIVP